MKKVFVTVKCNDKQKEMLENISKDYSITYDVDYDANIIIGNYKPTELVKFKNLEWIQTSAVGVDVYIKKGILADNVLLTNAVDVHSEEVAEHALALLISLIKKTYLYRDNQNKHSWHDEDKVKSLVGLKVSIIGLGNIGYVLAKLCKGLGMYVIGVKRTITEQYDYVDELYTNTDLDKAISNVDAIVTILPGTKENTHLFTLDTFKKMDKETILVNVGRGNLYSEDVLKEVLEKNIIKAIAMDVFEKEPIDGNSNLWDYQNLVITPHVAGYFHLDKAFDKYLKLVSENLRRYINNEKLMYIVDERE